MSEYQFIHFLAVDRPLRDEQLEFMRRQSTRAEITRWEFANRAASTWRPSRRTRTRQSPMSRGS
jgi:hypothetical protein